jgi:Zn-dependent protease with chaperone function
MVYGALAGALMLCFVTSRAVRSLTPPAAAVTLCASAVLAATAWAWNLGLLAGTLIGRFRYVADYGHWSRQALALRDPVPVVTAAIAVALIAVAVGSVLRCSQRVGWELWRVWYIVHACSEVSHDGVVVVAGSAPRAVAVPGIRGRVVITTAMIDALSVQERGVLLAHERTHLRCQHSLFRLAVRLSAAVLPVLKPIVRECDHQLERWADESAAVSVGDRGLAARALGRAALAGHRASRVTGSLSPGFAEQGVVSRVRALQTDPPRNHVGSLIVPIVVSIVTAALSIQASRQVDALFDFAIRAWSK